MKKINFLTIWQTYIDHICTLINIHKYLMSTETDTTNSDVSMLQF